MQILVANSSSSGWPGPGGGRRGGFRTVIAYGGESGGGPVRLERNIGSTSAWRRDRRRRFNILLSSPPGLTRPAAHESLFYTSALDWIWAILPTRDQRTTWTIRKIRTALPFAPGDDPSLAGRSGRDANPTRVPIRRRALPKEAARAARTGVRVTHTPPPPFRPKQVRPLP
jgi:hypothetical protein